MGGLLVVGLNCFYAIVFVTPLMLALFSLAQAGGVPRTWPVSGCGRPCWGSWWGWRCVLVLNRSLAQHLERARVECEGALEAVAGARRVLERARCPAGAGAAV